MIPLSIITGFLGSGKTTLLARLLREPHMSRTAVVINEFGSVGLDHELIETSDESLVQLSTGCLCCVSKSDLALTLADLYWRRAAGRVPPFDHVVVETTGMANPVPILHSLMTDAHFSEAYVLDGVITTVDAVNGLAALERHTEALNQAVMADRIVLTKTDLQGATPLPLSERLAKLNPDADIHVASYGAIPSKFLLGCGRNKNYLDLAKHVVREDDHTAHDKEVSAFTLVARQPLHAATLPLLLRALADNCGPDLLRVKGIVNVWEEPDRPAVIHGVQHVYHAPIWLERWPSTERSTRIVFVGRNLRPQWLQTLTEILDDEVHEETARRAH